MFSTVNHFQTCKAGRVNLAVVLNNDYCQTFQILEQGTKPPTVPRALQQYVCVVCVCVFTAVCVHLDALYAEHKFRVLVTISGHMSLHFTFTKFVYVWLRKSFYSRLLSE